MQLKKLAQRMAIFLSTPSVRRATANQLSRSQDILVISIHALRAEGDISLRRVEEGEPNISIHALRAEGDKDYPAIIKGAGLFLSTPSVRRATQELQKITLYKKYFYPRPPCGGRPSCPWWSRRATTISIHALRAEGDYIQRAKR